MIEREKYILLKTSETNKEDVSSITTDVNSGPDDFYLTILITLKAFSKKMNVPYEALLKMFIEILKCDELVDDLLKEISDENPDTLI